jgi:hypothetical protein
MELQHRDGTRRTVMLAAPRAIDLLQLSDGRTTDLVSGLAVEAGEYDWVRLMITAEQNLQSGSYIRLRDGRQFPLYIPSGAETGLKLQRRFAVAQGSVTRLVIDFDLRKSVVAPPGQAPNWLLRPALRLVDELQVGRVEGSVDPPSARHVPPADRGCISSPVPVRRQTTWMAARPMVRIRCSTAGCRTTASRPPCRTRSRSWRRAPIRSPRPATTTLMPVPVRASTTRPPSHLCPGNLRRRDTRRWGGRVAMSP